MFRTIDIAKISLSPDCLKDVDDELLLALKDKFHNTVNHIGKVISIERILTKTPGMIDSAKLRGEVVYDVTYEAIVYIPLIDECIFHCKMEKIEKHIKKGIFCIKGSDIKIIIPSVRMTETQIEHYKDYDYIDITVKGIRSPIGGKEITIIGTICELGYEIADAPRRQAELISNTQPVNPQFDLLEFTTDPRNVRQKCSFIKDKIMMAEELIETKPPNQWIFYRRVTNPSFSCQTRFLHIGHSYNISTPAFIEKRLSLR